MLYKKNFIPQTGQENSTTKIFRQISQGKNPAKIYKLTGQGNNSADVYRTLGQVKQPTKNFEQATTKKITSNADVDLNAEYYKSNVKK